MYVINPYYSVCVPVPAARSIHSRNVDPCAVHKPVLRGSQGQHRIADNPEEERAYIGEYNSCNRYEEDCITVHKG